jgi:hypothetical protein
MPRFRRFPAAMFASLLVIQLVACTGGREPDRPQPRAGTAGASSADGGQVSERTPTAEAAPAGESGGTGAGSAGGGAQGPTHRAPASFAGTLFVYSFDPLTGILTAGSPVEVSPDASSEAALDALLSRVNALWDGRRRIAAAGVAEVEGRQILTLDLLDEEEPTGPGSWYNSFQGSAGGAASQAFLVATFLQPAYAGAWFGGVRFLLNGEPVGEMDHVNLDGLFLRDGPSVSYATIAVTAVRYPPRFEMRSYLRGELGLDEGARVEVVPVRSAAGGDIAAFFILQPDRLVRRGAVALGADGPRLLREEEDPCSCLSLRSECVTLVPSEGGFVVTRFSPMTGSCVGLDVVRVLAVTDDGALREVWNGTTFHGNGPTSELAVVEFVDRDGDGNREILRRGRLVDCGDDCLCRDGPVLETFEEVYAWDPGSGRFAERSRVTGTSR